MSDEIVFREDMSVELVKSSASDADVIERLDYHCHLAALRERNRQIQVARTGRAGGEGRLDRALCHNKFDERFVKHRCIRTVEIDADVRANAIVETVVEEWRPDFRNTAWALVLHDYPLLPALNRLGADEPEAVALGEPAAGVLVGLVPIGGGAVVAGGLETLVGRFREPRDRRRVGHFSQQRWQGNGLRQAQRGLRQQQGR